MPPQLCEEAADILQKIQREAEYESSNHSYGSRTKYEERIYAVPYFNVDHVLQRMRDTFSSNSMGFYQNNPSKFIEALNENIRELDKEIKQGPENLLEYKKLIDTIVEATDIRTKTGGDRIMRNIGREQVKSSEYIRSISDRMCSLVLELEDKNYEYQRRRTPK
jgi:hypothetical protein